MAVAVRIAEEADRDALIALRWALNTAEIDMMPEANPLKPDRDPGFEAAVATYEAQAATVRAQGGEFLVAERDGAILGALSWHPEQRFKGIVESARGQAYIGGLVVAEAARGAGVGRTLMAAAEQRIRARGIRRISLGVVSWNAAAIAFYRDAGFLENELSLMKKLD